jgi:hypothetical protein
MADTKPRLFTHAVVGDHSRLVYSRHYSEPAAVRACLALARKWANPHPGSEPRVVALTSDTQTRRHID